jgi:hypothetical protein
LRTTGGGGVPDDMVTSQLTLGSACAVIMAATERLASVKNFFMGVPLLGSLSAFSDNNLKDNETNLPVVYNDK